MVFLSLMKTSRVFLLAVILLCLAPVMANSASSPDKSDGLWKDNIPAMAYEQLADADNVPRKRRIYEISKSMHRDLDYYVRVVDRHGEPMAGVKVILTSRGFSYFGPILTGRTEDRDTFITDKKGMVHLEKHSVSFYLDFRKDGYAFERFGDELNDR